jgi:hypothetical protein
MILKEIIVIDLKTARRKLPGEAGGNLENTHGQSRQ